jgi:hypothetical protein
MARTNRPENGYMPEHDDDDDYVHAPAQPVAHSSESARLVPKEDRESNERDDQAPERTPS